MSESETGVLLINQNQKSGDHRCNSVEIILRLNKIEGQVKGLRKMVDQKVYCDDVLNQVIAAQSALYSVGKLILENHIQNLLKDKFAEMEDHLFDELFTSINSLHHITVK